MKSFACICSTLLLVASVQGGTVPVKDGAWSSGTPMGWNGGGSGPVSVQLELAGEATGQVGVFGGQAAITEAFGNPSNPALIIVDAGSGGNAYQTGSAYQLSSSSNHDSSAGGQDTSMDNISNGFDYITVNAQGEFVDVASFGESEVFGSGNAASIHVINGEASGVGWKAPEEIV